MMSVAGSDNDTLITAQASSGEESINFSPLNSALSVSVSPYSLEVVPTKDINQSSFKYSKNYGSPTGNDINTRHVSGKKIDTKHTQFALSAGMMLGIRECVGGINSVSEATDFDEDEPIILEEECARVEKVKIPAGGYVISSYSAKLPYGYKFKAYAPHIFSRIRTFAGVEKQRFLHSICGNDAFIEFVSNAKSGQFFFYSHDGRYMIKTQTQEEKNFLRQILPSYYKHLKNNPHSFITHFYGMYRVKIPDLGKSVHFVIMKSVFNTEKEIHKIWDLKGSSLGRRAKRGDGVSKDLDFLDEGRKLNVGPMTKDAIMAQLRKDADFLAEMHIMDYSLLLGVHVSNKAEEEIEKKKLRLALQRSNTPMRRQLKEELINNGGNAGMIRNFFESAKDVLKMVTEEGTGENSDEDSDSDREEMTCPSICNNDLKTVLSENDEMSPLQSHSNPYTSRDDFGIVSVSGESKEIYFAGVIDILQLYNTRKWGETIMRKAIGNNEHAISCVHPETYAKRFIEFMDKIIT
jgi:1-phosphatidylinositol-4-phosphate 5-kinase